MPHNSHDVIESCDFSVKPVLVRLNELHKVNKELTSENAMNVLEKRYLRKVPSCDYYEEPINMFQRVATVIAQADSPWLDEKDRYKEEMVFLEMMARYEFLPNSPTLMNAGTDMGYAACFVIPISDSMADIFEAVKQVALIHKAGGGTGMSFSRLRPKNDIVSSTSGASSGPVVFMGVFDAATEAVKQGGKRRGANMGILRVDHPDILEFINCKQDKKKLNNFNISVMLTDSFMSAVKENGEYNLINPRTNAIVGTLNAAKVFNVIVTNAYETGEPGILFYDKINSYNVGNGLPLVESTNPCSEAHLSSHESCTLGSINLGKFVRYVDDNVPYIHWERLSDVVHMAIRFLDNVVECNNYPIPEIAEATLATRKIGLGVMGWADMLAQLHVRYDSEEGFDLAQTVMSFIERTAIVETEYLASEKGVFPAYKKTNFSIPRRNATVTCIAPTGTLSVIADCSSGIEPYYALEYTKNVMDGAKLVTYNKFFQRDVDAGYEDIHEIYRTAHDVSYTAHITMQHSFQKYTDMGISKTINMSHDATIEDVYNAYMTAWELSACKGLTIYRDGSRDNQVLTTETTPIKVVNEVPPVQENVPRERPDITTGKTERVRTGCGSLYVTVNEDYRGVCEVFCTMGRSGGCTASQSEAVSRLVSLGLRSGIPVAEIVEQLKGIRCPNPMWNKGRLVMSCSDAIAKVLSGWDGNTPDERKSSGGAGKALPKGDMAGVCPDCGGILESSEGCCICRSCGFSKCG